jgi:hypothetical protein
MNFSLKQIIVFLIIGMIAVGCATQVRPNGGPEDKQPPRLILDESEQNFQTNFNKKEFKLKFNEFVQLSNPSKQIFVSPPTTYIPKFEVRTNTVTVKFDEKEEFIEDATYQINFGEAIVDYNNSNKLKNFSFVFATGDIIDSLSLKGSIRDILTKKAVSEMTVLLYDQLDDSIVYKQKPLFFTRTDNKGNFTFNNIKSDTFKLFAVSDNNLSYTFDNDGEMIAYLDSTFILTDSSIFDFKLDAFFEKTEQRIIYDDSKTKRKITLGLKYPKESISYRFDQDSIRSFICEIEDSIYIYYDTTTVKFPFHIIHSADSIKVNPRKDFTSKLKPKEKARTIKSLYTAPIEIEFNECLYSVIDSLILVTDTALQKVKEVDLSIDQRQLIIQASFRDTSPYLITILPGGLNSFINSNTDTIKYSLQTQSIDDFGNIIVVCDSLDASVSYVFQLIKAKDLVREKIVTEVKQDSFVFENLIPGTYTLDVIEDINKDGTWTSGSYKSKTNAERQTSKELEKLRKGWDLNVTFDLNSLVKKSTK